MRDAKDKVRAGAKGWSSRPGRPGRTRFPARDVSSSQIDRERGRTTLGSSKEA